MSAMRASVSGLSGSPVRPSRATYAATTPGVGMAGWQTDTVSLVGLALESATAAGYLVLAAHAGRRHERWSPARTTAFLNGLLTLAVVLQSPFVRYDDGAWGHSVQHVVVMGVAPVLLALGAPVTLCLRALRTSQARRLVGVLQHRSLDRVCGPRASHAALDYYAAMVLYRLTPLYALSLRNEVAHVAVHVVFFTCGLLFWVPMVGVDVAGWRPSPRTRLVAVAAGVPVAALLAVAAGSWALLVAGELGAAFGLAVLLLC